MYILQSNGLEVGKDVFIEWKSEHAECVAALSSDASGCAMLPQPFAATAMMQNGNIRIALDLNDLWEAETGTVLITGVTVVRKDFAESSPDALRAFMDDYASSAAYAVSDVPRAAALIGEYGIVPIDIIAFVPAGKYNFEIIEMVAEIILHRGKMESRHLDLIPGFETVAFGVADNPFGSLSGRIMIVVHLVPAVCLRGPAYQFVEVDIFIGMVP